MPQSDFFKFVQVCEVKLCASERLPSEEIPIIHNVAFWNDGTFGQKKSYTLGDAEFPDALKWCSLGESDEVEITDGNGKILRKVLRIASLCPMDCDGRCSRACSYRRTIPSYIFLFCSLDFAKECGF